MTIQTNQMVLIKSLHILEMFALMLLPSEPWETKIIIKGSAEKK